MKKILLMVLLALFVFGMAAAGAKKDSAAMKAGDIIQMGGQDWRVLEVKRNKALLLSDKILFRKEFQKPVYGDFYLFPITWEKCTLRQYLNGEFFNSAFSDAEKNRIVETKLKNSNNPWYNTPGGNDTKDRVFCLSIDEVLKYFGSPGGFSQPDIETKALGNSSCLYDAGRVALTRDGEAARWWSRTPGQFFYMCESNHVMAASVSKDGSINVLGDYVHVASTGVRPAMWVKL